jgi:hypothetical protein
LKITSFSAYCNKITKMLENFAEMGKNAANAREKENKEIETLT